MGRGNIDHDKVRRLIKEIEREVYRKKPSIWDKLKKWLMQW